MLRSLTVLLLASCGGGSKSDGGETDPDISSSGDSLGMGETSATGTSPSDPTMPNVPTTSTTTPTSEPTTITASTTGADPSITLSDPMMTDGDPSTTTTDSGTSSSGSDGETTSTTSTTDSMCMDPGGLPQSADCSQADGCECKSGECFLVPILGGFCSECLGDADCANGGCTVPNPIGGVGAVCNDGSPGDGCETDAVCADPKFSHCSAVLDIPGIITVSTCGQCESNADCPANAPNCSPDYDVPDFTGTFMCVANKSVPNDAGCNLKEDGMGVPTGNKACKSGFCGEANVMGLLKMGICGECNADADCAPGESCSDPVVDLQQSVLIGSTCN